MGSRPSVMCSDHDRNIKVGPIRHPLGFPSRIRRAITGVVGLRDRNCSPVPDQLDSVNANREQRVDPFVIAFESGGSGREG